MAAANAYNGIRKLVFSEYLQIVSSVLAVILSVVIYFGTEPSVIGAFFGVGIVFGTFFMISIGLCTAILVISIAAAAISAKGLSLISMDETKYLKKALILSVVLIIALSVNALLFLIMPYIHCYIQIIINMVYTAVYILTVSGFGSLAKLHGHRNVASFGNVVLIIRGISLLLNSAALYAVGTALIPKAVCSLKDEVIVYAAAELLALFAGIIDIVYLKKCRETVIFI